MPRDDDSTVDQTEVSDHNTCPACGGPTRPHQETLVRLGHGEEIRYRERCVDPRCGAAVF
jgi:hypothetical protein